MSEGKVYLHRYNWQCLLVVSLMVSQKCWDDHSLGNVNFPAVWKKVAPAGEEIDINDVNFMEREFLSIIMCKVTVGMRLYTSCYYEIMALALLSASTKEIKAGGEFDKQNVRERYRTPSFYLVGYNKKYRDEGEEERGGNDYEDADARLTADREDELAVGAKLAHALFERRSTLEVLTKSPHALARAIGTSARQGGS